MRKIVLFVLMGAVLGGFPTGVHAQGVEELFRKVNPSVVVIRATGREVNSARGLVTYSEIGSGVLIADGKVMTAAHVVHSMDEIVVEFLGRSAADSDESLIRTAANLIPREIDPLRVIDIVGLDKQADGGTHVLSTDEVGRVVVTGTESKGKGNKRVRLEVHDVSENTGA